MSFEIVKTKAITAVFLKGSSTNKMLISVDSRQVGGSTWCLDHGGNKLYFSNSNLGKAVTNLFKLKYDAFIRRGKILKND